MLQYLGPGDGALLVDVADDEHRHSPALGQIHQGHGAVLHLADAAGGGGQLPVVHGLDGVHDEHVGLELGHRLGHVVHAGLGQQVELLAAHPQPLGPQLDLPLGFLAGDIEHLGKPA